MRSAKYFLMAVCAMFLLGGFASAQGRYDRDGGGRHADFDGALSDVIEARSLMNSGGRGMQNVMSSADAAAQALGQALSIEGRDSNNLPPPDATADTGNPLQRASDLLDKAHDRIAFAQEPNDSLRQQQNQADQYLNDARHGIQRVLGLEQRQGNGDRDRYDHDRDRGY